MAAQPTTLLLAHPVLGSHLRPCYMYVSGNIKLIDRLFVTDRNFLFSIEVSFDS